MKKICEYCGNYFETSDSVHGKRKRFCNTSCSAKWRVSKIGMPEITEEMKKNAADTLRNRWKDPEFRRKKTQWMKDHNPVYIDGVVEKAHQTRLKNGSYTNNFKYGNGKVSEYELKVMQMLKDCGFYYNYAISTKLARDAFPQEHFAVNYKPDFVNLVDRLCIEIDGNNHENSKQQDTDKKKERCLKFLGFTTIRFTHEQVDNGDFEKWLNLYQEKSQKR